MGCSSSTLMTKGTSKRYGVDTAIENLEHAYHCEFVPHHGDYNFEVDDDDPSLHGRSRKQRLALHREMEVTQVYNLLGIIGNGSMGEVTVVEKKEGSLRAVNQRATEQGMESPDRRYRKYSGGSCTSLENIATAAGATTTGSDAHPATTHANGATQSVAAAVDSGSTKPNRKYACKTVHTMQMKDNEIKEFINEIDILRNLDHPNIIQLFEVFKAERRVWIITELATGGDLSSRMDTMSEHDVATVVEQITRALYYMHQQNVCHRDLKLENIMYADASVDAPIKLIDFGLSNKFTRGEKMKRACGTIYAAAPELFFGEGYTEQADIWSIGVIAFVLLSKQYPFLKELEDIIDREKKENFEHAIYHFGDQWRERNISDYAKGFVNSCLKKNPQERWSTKAATNYVVEEWLPFVAVPEQDNEIDTTHRRQSVSSIRKRTRINSRLVAGMNKFVLYGELKKTIFMTMAYAMDKSSLHEIREIFTTLDIQGDGMITLPEFKMAFKEMHKQLEEETVENLFNGIDQDCSGRIHYNEFLAAVVESQGVITMEDLAEAFDRLDLDSKGYISKGDLKSLLGNEYNEDLVDRMIREADFKQNGQVDYDEFLSLMFDDEPSKGIKACGRPPYSLRNNETLNTFKEKLVQMELTSGDEPEANAQFVRT